MLGIALDATGTNAVNEAMDSNVEKSNFTKLSESRTIAGYTCDAYLLKQGTDESKVWISKSRVPVVSTYYESFQKMSSSGKNSIKINYGSNDEMLKFARAGRVMLGMETKNEKGEVMKMEVEDIKENDSYSFSTSGYENMMDFNKIRQDAQKQSGTN